MKTRQVIEEPCESKGSSTVLKTSQSGRPTGLVQQDQGLIYRALIVEYCGERVAGYIDYLTEPGTGGPTKAPWLRRKQGYHQCIPTWPAPVLLIGTADKLANLQDLCRLVRLRGDQAYQGFKHAGQALEEKKANEQWFYRECAAQFEARFAGLSRTTTSEAYLIGIRSLLDDLQETLQRL